MGRLHQIAAVFLALLLSVASAALACEGVTVGHGCCDTAEGMHNGAEARGKALPQACHGASSALDRTPMDCCSIGSSSARDRSLAPEAQRTSAPQRTLARLVPVAEAVARPVELAPRTDLPRTHDPGLFTLLSSYLL